KETAMEIVQKGGTEGVSPAQTQMVVAVCGVTRTTVGSPQVTQCARPMTIDIAKAVRTKDLVTVSQTVIHLDVKGVLSIPSFSTEDQVIGNSWQIRKRK